MSNSVNINVHHVTRIERHGNIVVNATNGAVEKIEWQVPEAPRFYEAMVRGQSYKDIQTIVSRICGICSITHSLAATKAVENAMGIEVSEQADKMRILMHYSEYLQSHVLHIGWRDQHPIIGNLRHPATVHPPVARRPARYHRLVIRSSQEIWPHPPGIKLLKLDFVLPGRRKGTVCPGNVNRPPVCVGCQCDVFRIFVAPFNLERGDTGTDHLRQVFDHAEIP